MRKRRLMLATLSLVGVLFFGHGAAAQSYWLPSKEVSLQVRQEPMVRSFIESQCAYQGKGTYVKDLKWSGKPEEDVQTVTHIINRAQVSVSETATKITYYNLYDKKEFSEIEELSIAFQMLTDVLTGKQPDPWMTWLLYICDYTIADKFDYSGDAGLNRFDKTIKTTGRALADDAIKTYGLKDFSRESQIEFLNKTVSSLFYNGWNKSFYYTFNIPLPRVASQYSDVKSVSADGLEICIALDQEWFDSLKAGTMDQIGFIYSDNPIAMIAARALGLDIKACWYNLSNIGQKHTTTINAQSL